MANQRDDCLHAGLFRDVFMRMWCPQCGGVFGTLVGKQSICPTSPRFPANMMEGYVIGLQRWQRLKSLADSPCHPYRVPVACPAP